MIPARIDQNGQLIAFRGWQWLTAEPDWDKQDWDQPSVSGLPIRRTDWRITLDIPELSPWRNRLWPFGAWLLKHPVPAGEYFQKFNIRHWYVYQGRIPASWFLEIDSNPILKVIPDHA